MLPVYGAGSTQKQKLALNCRLCEIFCTKHTSLSAACLHLPHCCILFFIVNCFLNFISLIFSYFYCLDYVIFFAVSFILNTKATSRICSFTVTIKFLNLESRKF